MSTIRTENVTTNYTDTFELLDHDYAIIQDHDYKPIHHIWSLAISQDQWEQATI